ncbi:MAG: hypothetical protein WBM13_12120 [Bacteroidia bacterium]
MTKKIADKVNTLCNVLENRFGFFATAFFVGFLLLLLGFVYVTPHFEAAYHGLQYSLLSLHPFEFSQPNALQNRILPSLIGYVFHLRGSLFFIVPLLFAWLFMSTLYFYYRKRVAQPIDALLFTGIIAFSCTLYIQLISPGYTDVIFYYFIFLSFISVRKLYLSSFFFSLALLTHESLLFLLPGLLMYSYYTNAPELAQKIKIVIAYLLAILPLFFYRYWVATHVDVEYDMGFYFSKKNIAFSLQKVLPLFPAGAFYAFKLFWFIPIYVLYKTIKHKEYFLFCILLIMLFATFSQLVIAFDISRMLCLAFPVFLISAEKLRDYWNENKFRHFLIVLTGLNFLVLQYHMSCDRLNPMLPLPYTMFIDFVGLSVN